MKKFLITLCMAAAAVAVHAQGSSLFDHAANIAPSFESFCMTKYGDVEGPSATGAVSFSVPVYTYKDPDFEIPVTLEYRYDGFKPGQSCGTVGLGWYLNAGGSVTRDVRGVPDDWYAPGNNAAGINGFCFTVLNRNSLDKTRYYRPGAAIYFPSSGVVYHDILSDTPCYKSPNASLTSAALFPSYEACPDLFHFAVDGMTGDFVLGPDGVNHVFGSDIYEGMFSVSISPVFYYVNTVSGNVLAPTVTLVRNDGYVFNFGGLINNTDFTRSVDNPMSADDNDLFFSSFHLYEIIAPNGRRATFRYSASPETVQSSDITMTGIISHTMIPSVQNATTKEKAYSSFNFLLEEIDIDGIPAVIFNYAAKASAEYAPGCFEVNTNSAAWNLNQVGLNPAPNERRLRSITVVDSATNVVRSCTLEHKYTSSVNASPKMFLSTVAIDGTGKFTFEYLNDSPSSKYPKCDTKGTDHWGYWNGKSNAHTAAGFIPIVAPNQQDASLFNISSTCRDANFTYSRYGALAKVTYPTGGCTEYGYEAHTAANVVDNLPSVGGYDYRANSTGIIPGGIRLKSCVNYDGHKRDTTLFKYMDCTSGASSGQLVFMPRYAMQIPFSVAYPTYFSGFACCISAMSGLNLFRNDHIIYSNVREIHPDKSWTDHCFTSFTDHPDHIPTPTSMGGKTLYSDPYSCSSEDYFAKAHQFMYMSFDGAPLRCRPSATRIYDADGDLRYEETITYGSRLAYDYVTGCNIMATFTEENLVGYNYFEESRKTVNHFDGGGSASMISERSFNDTGRCTRTYLHPANSPEGVKMYWKYNTETGWTDAVIETKVCGNSEFIISKEDFVYGHDNEDAIAPNPSPTEIRSYVINVPVELPAGGDVWSTSMLTADGTNTVMVRIVTYNDLYRPVRFMPAPMSFITWTWDARGRNVLSRTVNCATDTWTYEWKDMVGLDRQTLPGGFTRTYVYDGKNRLCRILDSDGDIDEEYEYNLENE